MDDPLVEAIAQAAGDLVEKRLYPKLPGGISVAPLFWELCFLMRQRQRLNPYAD